MSDLARTAVRGTLVVAAGNLAVRAAGFATTLYLMGRIGARDFGVFDYAAALLAIAGSLGDCAFTLGAVHRQERVSETFSACLVLRLAMVSGVLVLVAGASMAFQGPLSARTDLRVLGILAAAMVADAASDVLAARLSKALRFGRLVAMDVTTATVAAGVAITMAACGLGVWALVGNRVAATVVRITCVWVASVERTPLRLTREDALWLFRYGLPLWIGGLATTWLLKSDGLVVGSLLDSATLGQYGRAYALALVPLGLVTAVLTRVSFPLYARLQGERAMLSEAFRIASGTAFRLVAPMVAGMAVVMPDFVAVMHWTQWQPMVSIFRWLLLYALVRPLMDDAGSLLAAVGQPRAAGQTLVAQAVAMLFLCPLLTWRFRAEGAAASVGLVFAGGLAFWYIVYLPRFVDVAYGRMLLRPLLSVAVAAGAALGLGVWANLPAGLWGMLAKLFAITVVYGAAMLALDGSQILADLRALRRHVLGDRSRDV